MKNSIGGSVLSRLRRLFNFSSPSVLSEADSPPAGGAPAIPNPRERTLDQALDFTFTCVDLYRSIAPNGAASFEGRTIMEIGPGQDLGILLVLAGGSGKAIAVDRYSCAWDATYHPAFYSNLLKRTAEKYPGQSFAALRDVVDAGDHKGARLRIVHGGLADLSGLDGGCVDVCYSNAALEHLDRPREDLFELSRVTRSGGIGFHQIDFRDHRDFDRPLEFLTMTDQEFLEKAEEAKYSFGNRLRAFEYLRLFVDAGFSTRYESNMTVEPAYLADVAERLSDRYRSFSREDLTSISGRVFTTKL